MEKFKKKAEKNKNGKKENYKQKGGKESKKSGW